MATKDSGQFSFGGGQAVEFEEPTDKTEIEAYTDAEPRGPSERWLYWEAEIQASQEAEKRFREEAFQAETSYFGDEEKAYTAEEYKKTEHQTNIIHANIEVLKPLVFSDKPDPIIRRRFGGDGDNDPTDRISALVAQRLAEYLIDTSGFVSAIEQARDDWLIPGRGTVRVLYKADFSEEPMMGPDGIPVVGPDGMPVMAEKKTSESVRVRHWPWSRTFYSASNNWDEIRWAGFETPMTKKKIESRFGPEVAGAMTYPINGLKRDSRNISGDMRGLEPDKEQETSNTPSVTAHDQCIVFEFWDKESRKVVWWSPHYRDDVLDEVDDPLGLEEFFNSPKPLLAVTKNGMLTPRPDTAYYRARAEEIDVATQKLNAILKAISVSGVYPGGMVDEIRQLLDGSKNRMIPVQEWVAFLEKGGLGASGIIQWLPLDMFLKAAQALAAMREQAKQQLYEISGISDIVRGQSDPNETLGAQQIKGNYANLRLRDKQRTINLFTLEVIKIMVEVAVEHFDTKSIVDIVNLKSVPMTDADLDAMNAAVDQAKQMHAAAAQAAQVAQQPPPPEPPIPFFEQTSWERVHATLRDDMTRKFTLSIETDGTILSDQEEDKKQRVEFLQAFVAMSEGLFPLAQSGVVEMKVIKELLMFAVRGFPKSRTIEGMLSSLPDTINTEPKEDTAVTVAKIKAESDKMLAEMKLGVEDARDQKDRLHETRMKGADILAGAFMEKMKGDSAQAAAEARGAGSPQ